MSSTEQAHRCKRLEGHKQRHSLCSNVKGQDLGGVRDRQTRPCKTCHAVEEEDHGQDCFPSCFVAGLTVYGRTRRPDAERHQHTTGSDQKQFSSSEFVDKQDREQHSNQEIVYLEPSIKESLVVGICHANTLEDIVEVIRYQSIARALGEERNKRDECDASPVTFVGNHAFPTLRGELFFGSKGLADFKIFALN